MGYEFVGFIRSFSLANVPDVLRVLLRDMRRCFADELQITQRSIVVQSALHKTKLIQAIAIDKHFMGEIDHVVDIKMPFSLSRIRHKSALSQYKDATQDVMPFR